MELTVSWQTISPERTPQRPPAIKPVEPGNRPKWSVMIPVYNAGRYLEQTLNSVLGQALPEGEMQIEVVDDCSTDINVQAIVRDIGQGRVSYYRQPYNVGSLRNFETCLNLSKGYYIHILHSDDLVHPGFYEHLGSLFDTYPHIGAAFSRFKQIDENGATTALQDIEAPVACVLENWLLRLAEKRRIHYASIAVKRDVYEDLGGFYGVHYAEDWEMWARIATRYSFGYTPALLASSRTHEESISGQSRANGQNLKDLEFVMKKINTYLPASHREKILKGSKKFYAHYAVETASELWHKTKNTKGVLAQIQKGWRMYKDPILAYKILQVFGRIMTNR
ncbi:MAG TPA: glycosyltransferase [Ohtaekwangia sp.]|nr:glycosyltransferase [Ohtaekwangia sp.]